MHSRTIATLDQFENASWLSRVGINEGSGTVVVATWQEAMDRCDSTVWDDLQLEALNQYRVCIARRSRERLQLWNDAVDEVKKISRRLVDRKIAAVVREHALPDIFKLWSIGISLASAWKPNTRTCARPGFSRTFDIGISMDTFLAVGGAYFPKGRL